MKPPTKSVEWTDKSEAKRAEASVDKDEPKKTDEKADIDPPTSMREETDKFKRYEFSLTSIDLSINMSPRIVIESELCIRPPKDTPEKSAAGPETIRPSDCRDDVLDIAPSAQTADWTLRLDETIQDCEHERRETSAGCEPEETRPFRRRSDDTDIVPPTLNNCSTLAEDPRKVGE
jgi:hypothetical protein